MMEKEVQQLFDLAKDQAPQTSVKEVNAWVDKALVNVGFLAALKVLLTKKMIMISTTFTLITGIGIVVATQLNASEKVSIEEKNAPKATLNPVNKDSIRVVPTEASIEKSPLIAILSTVNEEIDQKMEVFETILLSPKMVEFKGETIQPNVIDWKEVSTQSFTEIEANGFVNFRIIQGSEDKVTVNQKDESKCMLHVEVKNGKLEMNSGAKNDINEIIVTVKELKKLELNGFCETEMVGDFKTDHFDVEINGFSKANLIIESNKIELEINGETQVNLTGNSTVLDAEINGFSTVALSGAFKESELEINGETKVILNGSGTTTDVEINGDSKLLGSGFEVENATIEGNGGSDVDMKVTKSLAVHLTGKCVVDIEGHPTVTEQELVGGAKLKL